MAPAWHAGVSFKLEEGYMEEEEGALAEAVAAEATEQEVQEEETTGVSMRYILDFGTQPMARQMLMSSRFLHGELPIRLAHRIIELNALPEELSQNLHVERVKAWYAESFHDLRVLPLVKEEADVVRFTELLRRLYARHGPVVPAVAKGVEEYKRQALQAGRSESGLQADLDPFLDRFFLSRIALRFLVGHHIALYEQSVKPEGQRRMDRIGMIHTKCSPLQVVSDAVDDAREVCIRTRGDAPDVNVIGSPALTFPYVPSHLHQMVFELVKNSLRAVAERYDKLDRSPPDINVVVAQGREDIAIKARGARPSPAAARKDAGQEQLQQPRQQWW
ncbi:hypothetical protein QJQ45_004475 [Haematococcus lacustris]|nr:hypothetical protein QJQ45_004475 [Haematococcus lacustris]